MGHPPESILALRSKYVTGRVLMRSRTGRTIALVILAAYIASRAHAQDPSTFNTPPTLTQIDSWLRSEDPRIVAWGAVYAQQSNDPGLASQLTYLASNWQPITREKNSGHPVTEPDFLRREAMAAVLDTLI